ncbi:NAD(P)H-binding protein [Nocardioides sp. MAH-18]|uniref:NAD(P)H-binding protein n=1 Tax=Nocardioides agri TaxID=2682843 RepID=A0A6L6XRI7_9ACTN|nr:MULTISPECIES: NAD(P)H-binding protein [unclassified Nocardioides]MBA2954926.1 NAD(P)H-binding protein [Nocardioides sp. CGMCC 1.13656]MVQ49780.1 NAD(P)H-binding protein [Nocardioides sp. MAH-18]
MDDDEQLRVLVAGATGFVGRHLVPALIERGDRVRAMTRRPESYDGPADAVGGDVSDAGSLAEALTDIDVAVYLVHSLAEDDFERKDAEAARGFGLACAATGVRQIVYLGGLGRDDDDLSSHLRSRREVERLLGEAGVPVTTLRAAVVVGAGGISWEITRQLVHNLPAMVVPKWATTLSQPIALDDVVRYLVGVIGTEAAYARTFEVGGPEQLTYIEMMQQASEQMTGHRLPILTAPVLTPELSSYWIATVTDVDVTTGRNLIESMRTEVVVTDDSIRELVPGEPLTYAEAVRRALEQARQGEQQDD